MHSTLVIARNYGSVLLVTHHLEGTCLAAVHTHLKPLRSRTTNTQRALHKPNAPSQAWTTGERTPVHRHTPAAEWSAPRPMPFQTWPSRLAYPIHRCLPGSQHDRCHSRRRHRPPPMRKRELRPQETPTGQRRHLPRLPPWPKTWREMRMSWARRAPAA